VAIAGRDRRPRPCAEHASLWCPELNVLIAGDQVLPKISTNVGVWPNEPTADALTWFLDGFSHFRRLPADALVLPSTASRSSACIRGSTSWWPITTRASTT